MKQHSTTVTKTLIVMIMMIMLLSCCSLVFGVDQINADPTVDITPPSSPSSSVLADQSKNKIYSQRDEIMKRFQQYLRLPTQHPNPDYLSAVDFLLQWTKNIFGGDSIKEVQISDKLKIGENSLLKYYIFHCKADKPSYIFTWKGRDPSKGSILINSHTDIVPVDKDQWKYPPFEATMVDDENNGGRGRRIYSRGSQDMKNVGAGYMEAIAAMMESGFQPERNLQVVFIAEEEIGAHYGWECLVEHHKDLWKELNVSFSIDEGLASGLDDDIIPIYYGENAANWFEITAVGNVGHGSQFIPETATEKIYRLLREKVFPFREQQQVQMRLQTSNPREKVQCGTVVTINLTGLRAGHTNKETGEFSSPNVIPRTATALFDMRTPPHIDLKEIKTMLRSWADFVNGTLKIIQQPDSNPVADLNDVTVRKFLDIVSRRMKTELRIFPAATDARYPRLAGVNTIGYSYMPNTKVLLHDHNEYLDEFTYLDSIVHYIAILEGLLQD